MLKTTRLNLMALERRETPARFTAILDTAETLQISAIRVVAIDPRSVQMDSRRASSFVTSDSAAETRRPSVHMIDNAILEQASEYTYMRMLELAPTTAFLEVTE
jgi:hypothetical protein